MFATSHWGKRIKERCVLCPYNQKETRMNKIDLDIRAKATQMGSTLWSFAAAAILGLILGTSSVAVPWWVYPVLFTQAFIGLARMFFDETGIDTADSVDYRSAQNAAVNLPATSSRHLAH